MLPPKGRVAERIVRDTPYRRNHGAPICWVRLRAVVLVPVTFKRKQGLILLDQIRAVDKVRLVKKSGAVADKTLLDTL